MCNIMRYIVDFDHLKEITANPEQDDVEYKEEQYLNNPGANLKIAKFVSGFANSEKGGSIIFGVADDGSLIGIELSKLDGYKRKIIDWIRNGISGSVFYDTYEIQYTDNPKLFFLIIDIPRSNLAPHLHIKDRIYYKREGPSIGSLSTQENGKFIPLSEREIYNLYRDRIELQDRLKKKEEYILNNIILKYNGIDSYFYFLIQPVYDVENFLVKSDEIRKLIWDTNNNYIFDTGESINKNYYGANIKFNYNKSETRIGQIWFLTSGEILIIEAIPRRPPQGKYQLEMKEVYETLGFMLKLYKNYYKNIIHLNPQFSLKVGFVNPSNIFLPDGIKTFIGDPEKKYIRESIDCKDYSDLDKMATDLFEKVSHWFNLDSYKDYFPAIEERLELSKDL